MLFASFLVLGFCMYHCHVSANSTHWKTAPTFSNNFPGTFSNNVFSNSTKLLNFLPIVNSFCQSKTLTDKLFYELLINLKTFFDFFANLLKTTPQIFQIINILLGKFLALSDFFSSFIILIIYFAYKAVWNNFCKN